MAEVVHVPTGCHLALKKFLAESTKSSLNDADQFLIPRHPRVLQLLGSGLDELGRRWQAFPLLQPVNARQLVELGGAPVALSLLTQAACGLAHLHENGIIVADLKPDNLLVEATRHPNIWQSCRLVIADLDLAHSSGSKKSYVAGTRGYLAPELLASRGGVSPASDIFALGAWLVWLISGREPFASELNPARMAHLCQMEMGNPTSRSDPRFSGVVWGHILGKMLDPNPSSRLRDGLQLLEFLSQMASNEDDWSLAMPGLIRNPFVGSPSNAELRARLRDDRKRLAECEVLAIQPDPSEPFDEFLEGVLGDLGWDELQPILFDVSSHREALLESMSREPRRPIVLNGLDPSGGSELRDVVEILKLIQLARRSGVVKHYPVLCVLPPGLDMAGAGLSMQSNGFRTYAGLPADDTSFHRWLSRCFTSRPIQAGVLERLSRKGALNPVGVTALIGLTAARNGLKMASGEVGLVESDAEFLIGEAARAVSGNRHLSDSAVGLYTVLAALPMGIDPLWIKDGSNDSDWTLAAAQLEAHGHIASTPLEPGGLRLRVRRQLDTAPDATSLPEMARLLTVLLNGATQAGSGDRDESLIAIRFLARTDDPPGRRRGRVLARILAGRGDFSVAWRLLQLKRRLQSKSSVDVSDVLDRISEAMALVRTESVETASPIFLQAIEMAHQLQTDWIVVRATLAWSIVEFDYGHREPAASGLKKCLAVIESSNQFLPRQLQVAVSLHVVRMRIADQADPDVVNHFRRIVNDQMVMQSAKAIALAKWGRRMFARGEGKEARACFTRAMRLIRHSSRFDVIGEVTTPLAIYHFHRGFLARSGRLLHRLGRWPQNAIGLTDRISRLSTTGGLAYEQGQVRRAHEVNVHLHELAKRIGHSALQSSAMQNLGHLLHLMHYPAESRRFLSESIRLRSGTASEFWNLALIHLAECELDIGRLVEAESLLAEIGDRGSVGSSELTWGFARRMLGRIRIQAGALDDGRNLLGEALSIFEGLKAADEILVTRLDCFSLDFSAAPRVEGDFALAALEREAKALGNWRIVAMVRLASLKWNAREETPDYEVELRALIRDALDRGFVSLEVDALKLLIDRLIWQGWFNEAQDALKAALARIKVAADGFTEPELRRAYLSSPKRQAFLELSARLKEAN